MWRRMLECCRQLAEAKLEAERAEAWRALVDDGVLPQGCLSSVDDPDALAALGECDALLSRYAFTPHPRLNAGQARIRIQAAILASLACRCAAGESREDELFRWSWRTGVSLFLKARRLNTPPQADQPVAWLLNCFRLPKGGLQAPSLVTESLQLLAARELRGTASLTGTPDLGVLAAQLAPWLVPEPPGGAPPEDVLLELVQLLQDGELALCELVLHWLERLGGVAAVPAYQAALLAMTGSEEAHHRERAARALARLGAAAGTPEVLPVALALFRDADSRVVEAAGELAGMLCSSPVRQQVFPELLRLMGSDDERVRRAACRAGQQASAADLPAEFVAGLLTLLRDPRTGVRADVCAVVPVFSLEQPPSAVLTALAACLEDAEGEVRSAALTALQSFRWMPSTPEIVAALVRLLADHNPHLRTGACGLLSKVQPPDSLVTPEFLAIMAHLEDEVVPALRREKLRLLQSLGAKALTPLVQESILRSLTEKAERIDESAWRIVWSHAEQFSPPLLLPGLLNLLHDPDEGVRESVREALARLGAVACTPEVLDVLERLARHPGEAFRLTACRTIRSLGPPAAARHVCDRVYILLEDPDPEVQTVAVRTLVVLAPALEKDELTRALLDVKYTAFDRRVREDAELALKRLGLA